MWPLAAWTFHCLKGAEKCGCWRCWCERCRWCRCLRASGGDLTGRDVREIFEFERWQPDLIGIATSPNDRSNDSDFAAEACLKYIFSFFFSLLVFNMWGFTLGWENSLRRSIGTAVLAGGGLSFYPEEDAETWRAPQAVQDENGQDICWRGGGGWREEETVLDLFSP